MDNINNNNTYQYTHGDIRISNIPGFRNREETISTARITPFFQQHHYNHSQNCHQINTMPQTNSSIPIDQRFKDRQIAILTQKNSQLTMDLLALQQQMSHPQLYSIFNSSNDNYSQVLDRLMPNSNNEHLQMQMRLLATALHEKTEELRQAREEHDLVMLERASVHRDLRDQACEIEELRQKLQENREKISNPENPPELKELQLSNINLQSQLASMGKTLEQTQLQHHQTCDKLDLVIHKCQLLKQSLVDMHFKNTNTTSPTVLKSSITNHQLTSDNNFPTPFHQCHSNQHRRHKSSITATTTPTTNDTTNTNICDLTTQPFITSSTSTSPANQVSSTVLVLSGQISVRDLRLFLLDLFIDNNTVSEPNFKLNPNDELIIINGQDVESWNYKSIIEHLELFNPLDVISVTIRRDNRVIGEFSSWSYNTTADRMLLDDCTPLWLVSSNNNHSGNLQIGDILKIDTLPNIGNQLERHYYITVTRLSKYTHLMENLNDKENGSQKSRLDDQSNVIKIDENCPPILPAKKTKSKHRPMSAITPPNTDLYVSQYSHCSTKSVPPIPPRSIASLQSSFIENTNEENEETLGSVNAGHEDNYAINDTNIASTSPLTSEVQDLNDTSSVANESGSNPKQTATGGGGIPMSASFSGHGNLPTSMPKLGKMRIVTVKVPSQQSFSLRDLGLCLAQSSYITKSQSDVDLLAPTSNSSNNGSGCGGNLTANANNNTTSTNINTDNICSLFIQSIIPNSAAFNCGLFVGDEIISINNQPVSKLISAPICSSTGSPSELIEHVLQFNHQMAQPRRFYLLIKVQFNPIKMAELCKMQSTVLSEKLWSPKNVLCDQHLNVGQLSNPHNHYPFNNAYDITNPGLMIASIHGGNAVSKRFNVIRSSSQVTVATTESLTTTTNNNDNTEVVITTPDTPISKIRQVKLNSVAMVNQIKVFGGCRSGIFISNIEYISENDEESTLSESRLLIGDRIIAIGSRNMERLIGEFAIESLNQITPNDSLTVVQDKLGLEAIQKNIYKQESFFIQASYSLQAILLNQMNSTNSICTANINNSTNTNSRQYYSPILTNSSSNSTSSNNHRNIKRALSVSSKLDKIPQINHNYLMFNKNDILLVDATILPLSVITDLSQSNKTCSSGVISQSVWHAWLVDRESGRMKCQGYIPSLSSMNNIKPVSSTSATITTHASHQHQHQHHHSLPINHHNNSYHRRCNSIGHKLLKHISGNTNSSSYNYSNPDDSADAPTGDVVSADKSCKHRHYNRNESTEILPLYIPIRRVTVSNDSCNTCNGFEHQPNRPIVLLGGHVDTIAIMMTHKWTNEFSVCSDWLANIICDKYQLVTMTTIESIQQMHSKSVYPIVLLLIYKSTKHMRRLRLSRTSQIKLDKSECHRIMATNERYMNQYSHLINGRVDVDTNNLDATLNEIRNLSSTIRSQPIWLRVDKFEYSNID